MSDCIAFDLFINNIDYKGQITSTFESSNNDVASTHVVDGDQAEQQLEAKRNGSYSDIVVQNRVGNHPDSHSSDHRNRG